MMSLSVARRVQLASQPFKVTITFHNLRPGFVSAWDAARAATPGFDSLSHDAQIAAVRAYMSQQ